MTVLVHHSANLPAASSYDGWFSTNGASHLPDLELARKLPRLSWRLEQGYSQSRELWWRLGRELGMDPTAELAQTPTGAISSDFGIMLAWSHLAESLTREDRTYLAVCDDPWLFRHLSTLPGVRAGKAPPLWQKAIFLRLRGVLSRLLVSFRVARAATRTRAMRKAHDKKDSVLLVYGHPDSNDRGHDAYFGNLMLEMTGIKRLLHTDGTPGHALELGRDGRTASLHGWGNVLFAAGLSGTRWRPGKRHFTGPQGWLIRRAAAMENSGGGPAMNRWQHHCQDRWLSAVRPSVVIWPWENHAWEREFCRAARRHGTRTVGYQHTVVGQHLINYSSASNPDGLESIPSTIICNGPAYRNELEAWGIPAERMIIGGAFRFNSFQGDIFDQQGPVYVPLSGIHETARHQLAAARIVGKSGRRVLIKDHPMYPFDFAESKNLTRTTTPLLKQKALSAVLYSTGTSGLEALLAGLPTFRLLPEDQIAVNVLPAEVNVPTLAIEDLPGALDNVQRPPPLNWESILSPVDMDIWKDILKGDG